MRKNSPPTRSLTHAATSSRRGLPGGLLASFRLQRGTMARSFGCITSWKLPDLCGIATPAGRAAGATKYCRICTTSRIGA